MPQIKYYTREVYGQKYRYPLDPEQAQNLFALTQRKTLSITDLHALASFGLEFIEVLQPDTIKD